MGKANIFFKDGKWHILGQMGAEIARFGNDGLKLGGGEAILKMGRLSGTLAGIAAIGSAAVAVGTVTGMTGLVTGDRVFVTKKTAFAGNVGFVGAIVPSTNTLNIWVANTKPDSAGSIPSCGVDVVYLR